MKNNDVNNNLRKRLDEIKGETSQSNVPVDEAMPSTREEVRNNTDAPPMDMSKIPVPDINEISKEVPGGVSTDPLMEIDINNGTLNGEKFEESDEVPAETDNASSDKQTVEESDDDLTPEERAARFREKNSMIELHEDEAVDNTPKGHPQDPNDTIDPSQLAALNEDSARKSAYLHELARADAERRAAQEEEAYLSSKGIKSSNNIDEIIDEIADNAAKKELDVEDEEDLTMLLQRMEEQKVFANVEENKVVAGPANFTVEVDDAYVDNITDIIEKNGIQILKKNGKTKSAVLNRFVNSGNKISVPLVNSGIFVTLTGAGIDEIIAMNQMSGDNDMREELNKLSHVCNHIVNSSVGPLTLSQLLDIVSYYDKDSLYYGLYAGTNPEDSEFQRYCTRCGGTYYNTVRTKDLLLNAEDFKGDEDEIKDNVTTMAKLVESSKLGKVYRKIHSNGMIIFVKHPSIKSYLETNQKISPETRRLYGRLVDMAYSIEKIAIRESENKFVEFTDPDEIIEIISKIKDPAEKYEIYDLIQEVRPSTLPTFGLKECVCPHCKALNPSEVYEMEDMIFTQAQRKEELEAMRWAAKNQLKQKEEKNKSKKE